MVKAFSLLQLKLPQMSVFHKTSVLGEPEKWLPGGLHVFQCTQPRLKPQHHMGGAEAPEEAPIHESQRPQQMPKEVKTPDKNPCQALERNAECLFPHCLGFPGMLFGLELYREAAHHLGNEVTGAVLPATGQQPAASHASSFPASALSFCDGFLGVF